jgi:Methyltransferase domain
VLVRPLPVEVDPYANDPGHWGASLVSLAEIIVPCLDAVRPRSVVEIGAYAGDVTRLLLDWSMSSGARITAIDPFPEDALVRLAEERPELELIRKTSHEALADMDPPDVAIIDGDHNYYTVSTELRLLERGADGQLPLLLMHDVCWPHGRRDSYFSPELIPEDHRQSMAEGVGLYPGEPGVRAGGLPYHYTAKREGGPRNGVLTAVEDFVDEREELQLAIVPAFFGLGVVWDRGAPWAKAVAGILEPWDRDPVLQRLEANRVLHLASSHVQLAEAARAKRRVSDQEQLLRELLKSKAFALAELVSKLRQGGRPAFSKDDVRRVLAD